MAEKYIVHLTAEEREELTALVSKGKSSAAKIRHAPRGPNWTDPGLPTPSRCISIPVAGIGSGGWSRA